MCALTESPSVTIKDLAGSSLRWDGRYRFGCQRAALSFAIPSVVCGPMALLIQTEAGTSGQSCAHLGLVALCSRGECGGETGTVSSGGESWDI